MRVTGTADLYKSLVSGLEEVGYKPTFKPQDIAKLRISDYNIVLKLTSENATLELTDRKDKMIVLHLGLSNGNQEEE